MEWLDVAWSVKEFFIHREKVYRGSGFASISAFYIDHLFHYTFLFIHNNIEL